MGSRVRHHTCNRSRWEPLTRRGRNAVLADAFGMNLFSIKARITMFTSPHQTGPGRMSGRQRFDLTSVLLCLLLAMQAQPSLHAQSNIDEYRIDLQAVTDATCRSLEAIPIANDAARRRGIDVQADAIDAAGQRIGAAFQLTVRAPQTEPSTAQLFCAGFGHPLLSQGGVFLFSGGELVVSSTSVLGVPADYVEVSVNSFGRGHVEVVDEAGQTLRKPIDPSLGGSVAQVIRFDRGEPVGSGGTLGRLRNLVVSAAEDRVAGIRLGVPVPTADLSVLTAEMAYPEGQAVLRPVQEGTLRLRLRNSGPDSSGAQLRFLLPDAIRLAPGEVRCSQTQVPGEARELAFCNLATLQSGQERALEIGLEAQNICRTGSLAFDLRPYIGSDAVRDPVPANNDALVPVSLVGDPASAECGVDLELDEGPQLSPFPNPNPFISPHVTPWFQVIPGQRHQVIHFVDNRHPSSHVDVVYRFQASPEVTVHAMRGDVRFRSGFENSAPLVAPTCDLVARECRIPALDRGKQARVFIEFSVSQPVSFTFAAEVEQDDPSSRVSEMDLSDNRVGAALTAQRGYQWEFHPLTTPASAAAGETSVVSLVGVDSDGVIVVRRDPDVVGGSNALSGLSPLRTDVHFSWIGASGVVVRELVVNSATSCRDLAPFDVALGSPGEQFGPRGISGHGPRNHSAFPQALDAGSGDLWYVVLCGRPTSNGLGYAVGATRLFRAARDGDVDVVHVWPGARAVAQLAVTDDGGLVLSENVTRSEVAASGVDARTSCPDGRDVPRNDFVVEQLTLGNAGPPQTEVLFSTTSLLRDTAAMSIKVAGQGSAQRVSVTVRESCGPDTPLYLEVDRQGQVADRSNRMPTEFMLMEPLPQNDGKFHYLTSRRHRFAETPAFSLQLIDGDSGMPIWRTTRDGWSEPRGGDAFDYASHFFYAARRLASNAWGDVVYAPGFSQFFFDAVGATWFYGPHGIRQRVLSVGEYLPELQGTFVLRDYYFRADPVRVAYDPVLAPSGELFVLGWLDPDIGATEPGTLARFGLFRGTPTVDNDGDGVPDVLEARGRSGNPDANGDGVPDAAQGNVAVLPVSFTPANRDASLTLSIDEAQAATSPSEVRFASVRSDPVPADAPADAQYPAGQIGFRVEGIVPGSLAVVRLRFPDGGGHATRYYKRRGGAWEAFDYDPASSTGAQFMDGGRQVDLHLRDGGRGDADGMANGVIIDPGLPACGLNERCQADAQPPTRGETIFVDGFED